MPSVPAATGDQPGDEPGGIVLEEGPVRQLRFTGRIGKGVVRDFRLQVRPAAWPSRVDLSAVTAMDSAGLELLLHLARKQKRFGGELEVVEPPAPLRRRMELGGLTRVSHWVPADHAARPAPPNPPLGTAASA
jgi:anti-anti-sigma factor